jgi:hypothetical protein
MELIMAKLLKVRKECLESEVSYGYHNSSYSVKLKDATQEQLAQIKEVGVDVFEADEKVK